MSRKMSCSLYGRRIQDTERMKGEKSGWVDGPDFEFLLYSIRQRFSGGGFISQLPVQCLKNIYSQAPVY